MMELILDGEKLTDRESLHDVFADVLHFPDWYGRNLDALFDCLTDLNEETELVFCNVGLLEEKLGSYLGLLIKTLGVAAEENPRIHLRVETE